jgi:formylmethanofuran dehydrogenase subunit B
MRAIKKAKKIIEKNPELAQARVLSQLVLSLESDTDFHIKQLYDLSQEDFDFAMQILKEWRIDRHYMGKAKTFEAAYHALSLGKKTATTTDKSGK